MSGNGIWVQSNKCKRKNNGVERGGTASRLWQQALAEECWYQGIQVHSSYLHHGTAGHRSRPGLVWSSAQLHWVVHHHISLEQNRGGHKGIALHTQTSMTSVKQRGLQLIPLILWHMVFLRKLYFLQLLRLAGSDGACPAVTIVKPVIVLLCPLNSSCGEPKAY